MNITWQDSARSAVMKTVGWCEKRWSERRKQRRMELMETLPLGAGRYISLVSVDGVTFLVGGAGNSVSILTRLSPPAENPQPIQS